MLPCRHKRRPSFGSLYLEAPEVRTMVSLFIVKLEHLSTFVHLCHRAGQMGFEQKLRVHAQLEVLINETNSLAGLGGVLAVIIMSLVAVSSIVAIIKLDSSLGIPVVMMVPIPALIAAVAIAFGFTGFKQVELLRSESITFVGE